jgi:TatD DNase family protein
MIDSHCHLDAAEYNKDVAEVVERARKIGVKAVVNPASTFASNQKALSLSEQFPGFIFSCAGLDPVHCLKENKVEGAVAFCREHRDGIVAIGEVGLDYYWSKDRDAQKENFRTFIRLASEMEKPLVVHARDAMADCLAVLEEERARNVVLHHFEGTQAEMLEATGRGYFISFATNICYSDSKSLIKTVPLDYLLVETDGPYLHPLRQRRNEPANVGFAIERIARQASLEFGAVEALTERNARKAFGGLGNA